MPRQAGTEGLGGTLAKNTAIEPHDQFGGHYDPVEE
jgi:hypothetical protein